MLLVTWVPCCKPLLLFKQVVVKSLLFSPPFGKCIVFIPCHFSLSLPLPLSPSLSLLLLFPSRCCSVKYVIGLFAGLLKLHTLDSPKSCNMLVLCNTVLLQTSNLCSNILESEVCVLLSMQNSTCHRYRLVIRPVRCRWSICFA